MKTEKSDKQVTDRNTPSEIYRDIKDLRRMLRQLQREEYNDVRDKLKDWLQELEQIKTPV